MNIFSICSEQRFFFQKKVNPFFPEEPRIITKIHYFIDRTKTMLKFITITNELRCPVVPLIQYSTMRTNKCVPTTARF